MPFAYGSHAKVNFQPLDERFWQPIRSSGKGSGKQQCAMIRVSSHESAARVKVRRRTRCHRLAVIQGNPGKTKTQGFLLSLRLRFQGPAMTRSMPGVTYDHKYAAVGQQQSKKLKCRYASQATELRILHDMLEGE